MKLSDYNLWTALVTPLTPGLQVDLTSLKTLIEEQCEAKNGLLILGSTGEALNLSLEARKQIVEFTIEQNPSSPIMIGVGGHALQEQIEWIEWLETKKIVPNRKSMNSGNGDCSKMKNEDGKSLT